MDSKIVPNKSIVFPQAQLKALKRRLQLFEPVWTTRVSAAYDKYNKGDILKSNLTQQPLYVSQAQDIESLGQHRFKQFLTPEQKTDLQKYKKMRVLKLVPYSRGDNAIYNQSAGKDVIDAKGNKIHKKFRIAYLLKRLKQEGVKPVDFPISDLQSGALSSKLDHTWGNGKYKLAPALTVKQFATNHYPRIQKADLKYPIIVWKKKYVADGLHRLVKAIAKGKSHIKAYVVPDKLLRDIADEV